MKFHNTKEIEKYLKARCYKTIMGVQREIHELIHKFLRDFYHEYDPIIYEREWELLNSLVKTDIKQTANGFEAVVYFDEDLMNHLTGTWSEKQILDVAMVGSSDGSYPHGAYYGAGGTGIWVKTEEELRDGKEIFVKFKEFLYLNGIYGKFENGIYS